MSPIRRRQFLIASGALFAAPFAVAQQGDRVRRVGVIGISTRAKEEIMLKPFFDQMRALGWIEGQNITYDWVYADDQHEKLPKLAAELVTRKPEVIYAPPSPAAKAAKQATQTIPIVFGAVTDPVGGGLVASLARPGGNMTGVSSGFTSLAPKRLQLLREILPRAKRIGDLIDPNDATSLASQRALEPLAASLGMTIIFAEASNPVEFDAAVAKLIAARVDAIIAGTAAIATNLRARLIELTNQKRVPVIGNMAIFAEAGALISYGATLADYLRRSALPVDKILKGAKPADIPVEQPELFELVINLKAAKALGITIPQSVLISATKVIE